MSSILIKGMKMPKYGGVTINIWADGHVYIFGKNPMMLHDTAIELPDHEDLIEKGPLFKKAEELEEQARAEIERYKLGETNWEQTETAKWRIARLERIGFKHNIADAPVVIPAERSE